MTIERNYDALFAAVRAKREAAGTNVHFINDRGEQDSYSFATADRAAKFKAKLVELGRTITA